MIHNVLTICLATPLLGALLIAFLPDKISRTIALICSCLLVAITAYLGASFHPEFSGMQFVEKINWIKWPFPVQYHVGLDGMSLCLVGLTSVIVLMATLASREIAKHRPKLYYSMLMLLTVSIIGVFVSLDLVQFFVLYELELVPMYFLIAIWGGPNKDYAAMKFLLYTFLGGIFMLAAILYMYYQLVLTSAAQQTFDMVELAKSTPLLIHAAQGLSCFGFMLAFLIKLPSFPFHTWLPDAHVEAPTPISMILAGLLLKMGSYGLVRICLGFFPDVIATFGPYIIALGAFNVVWAAIACLVQDDMKRIIAFSSVSHMGFILIGLGSLSAAALNGAIFQMVSHGVISAALFFLVGVIYDRCHTRSISDVGGGLAKRMPCAFYFWMLAALANLGLPGLAGFVAEATILYGAFTSPIAALVQQASFVKGCLVLASCGVILTAGYMLWLLKRLFFGEEQAKWVNIADMKFTEKLVASVLSFFIVALGVYPLWLTKQYTLVSDKMCKDFLARNTLSLKSIPTD